MITVTHCWFSLPQRFFKPKVCSSDAEVFHWRNLDPFYGDDMNIKSCPARNNLIISQTLRKQKQICLSVGWLWEKKWEGWFSFLSTSPFFFYFNGLVHVEHVIYNVAPLLRIPVMEVKPILERVCHMSKVMNGRWFIKSPGLFGSLPGFVPTVFLCV